MSTSMLAGPSSKRPAVPFATLCASILACIIMYITAFPSAASCVAPCPEALPLECSTLAALVQEQLEPTSNHCLTVFGTDLSLDLLVHALRNSRVNFRHHLFPCACLCTHDKSGKQHAQLSAYLLHYPWNRRQMRVIQCQNSCCVSKDSHSKRHTSAQSLRVPKLGILPPRARRPCISSSSANSGCSCSSSFSCMPQNQIKRRPLSTTRCSIDPLVIYKQNQKQQQKP